MIRAYAREELLSMDGCHIFRCDLSENQDQQGEDSGCRSYISISQNFNGKGSHERRNRHIYNVVSDQDGTEHFGRIGDDFFENSSPFISLFCKRLYSYFIDGCHCGFCRGKKGRKSNQDHDGDSLKDNT